MAKKNKNNLKTGELTQQSLEYLSLSKQPFANEILTDISFFNNQSLSKILDSLTHQIQFSDLILLVEGINGSGKTSLFRKLIQSDIPNTKVLSIQSEATDTLVQIQQKMSLHLQDLGDANHLEDNLKSLLSFDQTPLIVMDSSHVLSDTTLQELFRYQNELKQEHEVTLKILFFANSGMKDTLQSITDIQSDQMYLQSIPELSPKQIENFIMHRLQQANYSGEPLLDDNAIENLSKKSNGTPLDIMTNAAPIINKIVALKIKPASSIWIKALIATIIVALLALSGYLYFSLNSQKSNQVPIASTNNIPPVLFNDTKNNANDVIEVLENDTSPLNQTLETKEESLNTETPPTTGITTDISVENINNNIPITNEIDQSEVTPKLDSKTTISDHSSVPAPTTKPALEPIPKPKKIIEKAEAPIAPTIKLNPALLQLTKLGLQDASWLIEQNNNHWTLQLLGAREPETLLKFALSNKLSANTAWYKTWLTSKPYYVLVYGSYSSREIARESIATLPKPLRSLKPWVKSIKSVQQAIK